MLSYRVSVMERWTDGSLKMLGVWLCLDIQADKIWDEITNRMVSLSKRKGRVVVANTCIASVIYYSLTVVPCPDDLVTIMEHKILRFLWN